VKKGVVGFDPAPEPAKKKTPLSDWQKGRRKGEKPRHTCVAKKKKKRKRDRFVCVGEKRKKKTEPLRN